MRDLRTFETFYWVAKLGGFRAAATKLNTTQPAVSARIAQLEQELGIELFDANRRRASLTARGEALLEHTQRLLQVRDDMLAAVAEPTAFRGKLTIGTSETLVRTWLSNLIETISTQYPNLTIDIAVDNTPELRQRILAQDLDIAFMTDSMPHEQVRNDKLCSYPFRFVVAADFPEEALENSQPDSASACCAADGLFARYPIITWPAYTTASTHVMDRIRAALGLSDVRLWGVSSVQTIIDMVHAGRGIGALSSVLVRPALSSGALRVLDTSVALSDLEFYAVHLKNSANSALKQAICRLAQDAAASYMP